ncbi:MAG: phosphoglycerate dehydrogenase [Anaerolineales bacterium]|nr:phosphoglycerate dehydrogenase [Anaerolineales bacterium]
MTTVLLSAPYLIPIRDRIRPFLESYGIELLVAPVVERLNEPDLLEFAGQFDGALCGDDQYTARVLEACAPRLKVISKWGTGIDSIDQAAAARLGIMVGRTPNAFTLPVADAVFGYMIEFCRHLAQMDRAMKSGVWEKIPGRSLSECTLGVVGVGTIGKMVLRRGRAFGMRLIGNDIVEIAPDFVRETELQVAPLEQLLEQSDFVSLHTDLNPTSYHLINRRTLAHMRAGAYLINTARGPVVEEAALVEALQGGKIAGAALDVFEVEPLPKESPLLGMSNVLLAPHNSNSSPAAWQRVHQNTLRNLLAGLGMTPPEIFPVF